MKSFVVMSYYHLLHAIVMTLNMNEKTNLFIQVDYMQINNEFINKINETEIFANVVPMTHNDINKKILEAIKDADPEESKTSIFDKYIEPYYEDKFQVADKEDDIYVYNDLRWYYYYITRHFKNIICVEDGYGSLKQQIKLQSMRGGNEPLNKFIPKYYPDFTYRHGQVKKIISSVEFKDIDAIYKDKLEIIDFKQLEKNHKDKLAVILSKIFQFNSESIANDNTLYLTQPLDRAMYCNALENYKLTKKVIREHTPEEGILYIKPHPAEKLNYEIFSSDRVKILDKKFPVEILNLVDVKFNNIVTFSSTSIDNFDDQSNKEIIFKEKIENRETLKNFIKNYIKDETVTVDYFIPITEKSYECFFNIYGLTRNNKSIKSNIYLLVEKKKAEELREFYEADNFAMYVKKYLGIYNYEKEILIKKLAAIDLPEINIIENENKWNSDVDIYNHNIDKNTENDFFMIFNSNNNGFSVAGAIINSLKKKIPLCLQFLNCIISDSEKKHLGFAAPLFENKIYHYARTKNIDVNQDDILMRYNCEMISDVQNNNRNEEKTPYEYINNLKAKKDGITESDISNCLSQYSEMELLESLDEYIKERNAVYNKMVYKNKEKYDYLEKEIQYLVRENYFIDSKKKKKLGHFNKLYNLLK